MHDRTCLQIGVSWAHITCLRRDWRYQKGNQNPYIEEQTTQWQKKVQKDKLRSTKHTHKTKNRVTRTPLKAGGELRCSGMVGSSSSTSGTRRCNLVTNPMISHEWWKALATFYWCACTNPGKWAVILIFVRGSNFSSFYDFLIGFRNCSDSVVFLFCFSFYFYDWRRKKEKRTFSNR